MSNYDELYNILSDIQSDLHVQEMKKYKQHGNVTTYEHCENVAKLCYLFDKKLFLHTDLKSLLTGAMLHDFYLYDWHNKDDGKHRLHGFIHAKRAAENAKKYFAVNSDVSHIIYCHMWPINITSLPMSKEAWLVCIADKCIAVYESFLRR